MFISKGEVRQPGTPSIWFDLDLPDEPNSWLIFAVCARGGSINTWEAAARGVAAFLNYCHASGLDWRDVAEFDLIEWRDAMARTISPNGTPYARATIRSYMAYAIDFLRYCAKEGCLNNDIDLSVRATNAYRRVDSDMLAHTRKGSSRNTATAILPKSPHPQPINVMRDREVKAFLRAAGVPPTNSKGHVFRSGESARNWLLMAVGVMTGLRKSEILSLDVHPFNAIVFDPEKPNLMHNISVVGKGNKPRNVAFPSRLIAEIHAYIDRERKSALAKRGGGARESKLFLIEKHRRSGWPLQDLDDIMEQCCRRAGLVTDVDKIDPETGQVFTVCVPKFSVHDLRHSYAVRAYFAYRAADRSLGAKDLEVWKIIQANLGHESAQTTCNIYLKYVGLFDESREVDLWSEVNA